MGQVKRGAVGGLGVLAGRVSSRYLPDVTGVSKMIAGGSMGSGVATAALAGAQLVSGILFAMLVKGFVGAEVAARMVDGAFDGVYEDVATSFTGTIPVIGQYLGGYSSTLPALAQASLGGYSRPAAVGVRGYATPGRAGGTALRRIGIGGGRGTR